MTDPSAVASDRAAAASQAGTAAPDLAPNLAPNLPPDLAPDPQPSAAPAPAEPRQRWRLTFARDPVATDLVGRPGLDAWQDALLASGLPWAGLEPGGPRRARIAFAAPLPAAARGESELVDVWLLERRPAWTVREGLEDRMPAAHRWLDAESVWLGAPALAGQVSAADWRVELDDVEAGGRDRIAEAAAALLAAAEVPRIRMKGAIERRYDLRPLLADLRLRDAAEGGLVLRIRTRFEPELGSGRPEEVVAALADVIGLPLGICSITRERLVLADAPVNRPAAPWPRPRRR